MRDHLARFLRGKECYIASADSQGMPHLTIGRVEAADAAGLQVSGWFCPRTVANLEENAFLSVAVRQEHEGYQLLGRVESKTMDAVLDGYATGEKEGIPQVRYRLKIQVDEVLEMGDKPHADAPVA